MEGIQMTKKEIEAIMATISGCQLVISRLAGDEKGLMSGCPDKVLYDTYFRLTDCWLYLRTMIKEVRE
jgi:hypothetical protein